MLCILARQPESPFRSGITGSNCRCEHTNNEHPVAQITFRLHSSQEHYAVNQGLYTPDVQQISNTKVQNVWLITLHASSHMNLHQKIQENENLTSQRGGKNGLILPWWRSCRCHASQEKEEEVLGSPPSCKVGIGRESFTSSWKSWNCIRAGFSMLLRKFRRLIDNEVVDHFVVNVVVVGDRYGIWSTQPWLIPLVHSVKVRSFFLGTPSAYPCWICARGLHVFSEGLCSQTSDSHSLLPSHCWTSPPKEELTGASDSCVLVPEHTHSKCNGPWLYFSLFYK